MNTHPHPIASAFRAEPNSGLWLNLTLRFLPIAALIVLLGVLVFSAQG